MIPKRLMPITLFFLLNTMIHSLLFSMVGFKANLPLLDICLCFPGGLKQMEVIYFQNRSGFENESRDPLLRVDVGDFFGTLAAPVAQQCVFVALVGLFVFPSFQQTFLLGPILSMDTSFQKTAITPGETGF